MAKYQYRSLPCNITTSKKLWCVCGAILKNGKITGGGVLEWCYDQADAEAILKEMKKFSWEFSNLVAKPYRSSN